MKLGADLSFSWKRALGVTKAKRPVSQKPGIPFDKTWYLRPMSSELCSFA